jgi:hypothetical protein
MFDAAALDVDPLAVVFGVWPNASEAKLGRASRTGRRDWVSKPSQ